MNSSMFWVHEEAWQDSSKKRWMQGCHRRLFFYYFDYQFFCKILFNFKIHAKVNTILHLLYLLWRVQTTCMSSCVKCKVSTLPHYSNAVHPDSMIRCIVSSLREPEALFLREDKLLQHEKALFNTQRKFVNVFITQTIF